jgi:hypothetical protein
MAILVTKKVRIARPVRRNARNRQVTPGWRLAAVVCALSTVCGLAAMNEHIKADAYKEYEIKAAFLYKFTGFVDWPPAAFPADDTPILIGVLGEDPFGTSLDDIVRNKKAKNRDIQVKRSNEAADLKNCHIVFVCSSEKGRLKTLFSDFKGTSVLTVGDTNSFAKLGGMINLVPVDNKIGLEINVAAAKNAGLAISSQLLNLAKTVYGKEGDKP